MFLEWTTRNVELLIVITSICAIFISCASLLATIIFSRLQNKHNKNSVKPICFINPLVYENLMGLVITNNGTGPLTISDIKFHQDMQTSESLLPLLPTGNRKFRRIILSVKGFTIPAGSNLPLFTITPETEEVKTQYMDAMKRLKITIEYMDIYNTKYLYERDLSVFYSNINKYLPLEKENPNILFE